MKVNTKKNNNVNDQVAENLIVVKRAKEFDWGILFDMIVNDVTIYGCKLLTNEKDEMFVSFPSRKGTNGNYYNYVYVKLSVEDIQNIVAQIEKM